MTLDEAIEHAKQVARTCEDNQCAAEHIQLAEWLRTAMGAEAAGRWHTAKVRELEAENAKLRELSENLLMAFVYLETPEEQQKCIDRALDLRRELDVLPMETFDARELGMGV